MCLDRLQIAGLRLLLENRDKSERILFHYSNLTKLDIAKMTRNELFKTFILRLQEMNIETKRNFWSSAL